jgi:hypothetical protein
MRWSQKSAVADCQPSKPLYRRWFRYEGDVSDHMFHASKCPQWSHSTDPENL